MREGDAHGRGPCDRFHRAMELVGRKWTGAIVYVLLGSPSRFAAIGRAIPDITDRVLSERLQELEAEEIVERTVTPSTPVRVEYSLTKKGRALAAVVREMTDWAHRWGNPGPAPGHRRPPRRRRSA